MARIKWTHKDINEKIMAAILEPAPPPTMAMTPGAGGTQPAGGNPMIERLKAIAQQKQQGGNTGAMQ